MTTIATLLPAFAVQPVREAVLDEEHTHPRVWQETDCEHLTPSDCVFCCPDVTCQARAELVRLAVSDPDRVLAPVGAAEWAEGGATLTDVHGLVRVGIFALVLPADGRGDPFCCEHHARREYADEAAFAEDCHAEIAVWGPHGLHRVENTPAWAYGAAKALAEEV